MKLQADVLILGGGPAGCWAALSALSHGAKVVIADKGFVSTSGSMAAASCGTARSISSFTPYDAAGGYLARKYRQFKIILEVAKNEHKLESWTKHYRYLQSLEVMRIFRRQLLKSGVKILDHSPALELLVDESGIVSGARGRQSQREFTPWEVEAKATVLATGGCSWLSSTLGGNTNTGDGLLMASEVGAELSGMEFGNFYSYAPKGTSMTKGLYYKYATFVDADGREISRTEKFEVAEALRRGPVRCKLNKAPTHLRSVMKVMQPNLFLVFEKLGIDPFTEWWEIDCVLEGTMRGSGGIHVTDECMTTAIGLYAAGDVACRTPVVGAWLIPEAYMTWVVGSGNIAGRGAASFARERSQIINATSRAAAGLGSASFDARRVIKATQAEILPLDKTMFRTREKLLSSLRIFDGLWEQIRNGSDHSAPVKSREAAAMIIAARWGATAALERTETRGYHIRLDHPHQDPAQHDYINIGGLDSIWVRRDRIT